MQLGGRCASSAPFKQYSITHKKNAGPTFVPLTILDLDFTKNVNEQKPFLAPTVSVFENFDFSVSYVIKKIFFHLFSHKNYLNSHNLLKNKDFQKRPL